MTVQVGYGPLDRVDGPPPLPPLYGLLKAAEVPAAGVQLLTGDDVPQNRTDAERWINGVEVYPYPPSTGDAFDTCSTGSDADTKSFGDEGFTSFQNPQFAAMTVYLPEVCKTFKVWSQEEFKARAVAVLAAVESSIIAREFMTGNRLTLNPHLTDGTGNFPQGNTVLTPGFALGVLESEIAKSGRQGLIHCTPLMATVLKEKFALDNRTGVIRTINGTVIIPDAGYTPVSGISFNPAGHAVAVPPQEWMFATGPVDIRRTEVFTMPETVTQATDRSLGATNGRSNTITYRAERYYLVTWDNIVHSQVLVDPTK